MSPKDSQPISTKVASKTQVFGTPRGEFSHSLKFHCLPPRAGDFDKRWLIDLGGQGKQEESTGGISEKMRG